MASKALPGQFDKSHALTAIPLVGASEVLETPEEFPGIENEDAAYEPKEHLKGWQADPQARDQILTIQGDDVKIDWVYKGSNLETNHSRQVSVARAIRDFPCRDVQMLTRALHRNGQKSTAFGPRLARWSRLYTVQVLACGEVPHSTAFTDSLTLART